MRPEFRLQVIQEATIKLLMVNPSIIVDFAHKVVANPNEYSAELVQLCHALIVEQEALTVTVIPVFKPIIPRSSPVARRQAELQTA